MGSDVRRSPPWHGGSQHIGNVSIGPGSNAWIGQFSIDEDQQVRECCRWLAPWLSGEDPRYTPSQDELLQGHRGSCADGTGSWLINDLLPSWRRSGQGHLWLVGNVGCGKTVLCSSVIRSLEHSFTTAEDHVLHAFAFCAFNLKYSHLRHFVTRTLLARLCSLPAALAIALGARKNVMRGVVFEELLEKVFSAIDQRTSTTQFIELVLDAIDEIPNIKARTGLLLELEWLIKLSRRYERIRLRIILFTRDSQDISAVFDTRQDWQRHEIPRTTVQGDIYRAMLQRLNSHIKMRRLPELDQDHLARRINAKADGMFRLASLYMSELEKSNISKINLTFLEKKLDNMPTELYGKYDEFMRKIEDSDIRSRLLSGLRLFLFSAGHLHVEDLAEACATSPPWPNAADSDECDRVPVRDVVDHLSGLLVTRPALPLILDDELDHRKYLVTFAHFSVAEYLLRTNASQWRLDITDHFKAEDVQLFLTQVCFRYCARDPSSPLTAYARKFWSHHAAAYIQHTKTTSTVEDIARAIDAAISGAQGLTQALPLAFQLRTALRPNLGSDNVQVKAELKAELDGLARRCGYNNDSDIDDLFRVLPAAEPPQIDAPTRHAEDPLGINHLYMYEPLPYEHAIRLCVLYPAQNGGDTIQASVFTDSLENQPEYTFLSYAWGSWENQMQISIDGKAYFITPNLHAALLRLRHETEEIYLWVDAICINQPDIMERTYQMSILSEIYQRASKTILWVGEQTEHTQVLETALHNGQNLSTADNARAALQTAIQDLMSRPVWQRQWVFPEIVVAAQLLVQWGSVNFSWDALSQLLRHFDLVAVADQGGVFSRITRLRGSERQPHLPEILYLCRQCSCSDPRDKVYGLASLLMEDEQELIIMDYELPTSKVYLDVASAIIHRYGNLDILSMCIPPDVHAARQTETSWVPDWSTTTMTRPLAPGMFSPHSISNRARPYCASYGAIFQAVISDESGSSLSRPNLSIEGILLDQIYSIRSEHTIHFDMAFTTRGELAGHGLGTIRRDDVVAILFGGSVPYILRPTEVEDTFTFQGECYVEGIMYGEGMQEYLAGRQEAREIILI